MSELAIRESAKVVLEAENAILVLHPSDIDANRRWHIPGGIRDDSSEMLSDTGIREVREETGLVLEEPLEEVVMEAEWTAVDKGENVLIRAKFFRVVLPKRPKIVLSDEHDNFAWLTLANHQDYDANNEVHELVGLLLS